MEKLNLITGIESDTLKGLTSSPKYLLSRYFYDERGSSIFQEIMKMPEYYLTDCEFEIFTSSKGQMKDAFIRGVAGFDLIELGSGDGFKTKILLHYLKEQSVQFKYIPIDICQKANTDLEYELRLEIPEIPVEPKTGDYFQIMEGLNQKSTKRKIILFLGANIGNFSDKEIEIFLRQLSEFTHSGDKVLIGFDLKKSPELIMRAYNDPHGHTRDFNLNHLIRLNRELGANFNPDNFEHHTHYNPLSGAVKSFLVSKTEQEVFLPGIEQTIQFKKWEPILMELSRKYDLETIKSLALNYGFEVENNFTDSRNYFVDTLWVKK